MKNKIMIHSKGSAISKAAQLLLKSKTFPKALNERTARFLDELMTFSFERPSNKGKVLKFIDEDIIPRLKSQGHKIESYVPKYHFLDRPKNYAERVLPQGNMSHHNRLTGLVNLLKSLNKVPFNVAIHEIGHGIRWGLGKYPTMSRKTFGKFVKDLTTKNELSDKVIKKIDPKLLTILQENRLKQIHNNTEKELLSKAYPWVNDYVNSEGVGIDALSEQAALNTELRGVLSNNADLVGDNLTKFINEYVPDGVILRKLMEEPYTSGIVDDISKITGLDQIDISISTASKLEELALQFPKLKEITSNVRNALTTVGGLASPILLYNAYDLNK